MPLNGDIYIFKSCEISLGNFHGVEQENKKSSFAESAEVLKMKNNLRERKILKL